MGQLSPMMQKYLETKEQYKDCILFYRLGDFYEMFFDDAVLVSKELELTLTGKDCGLEERAPMCGIPYHAVDTYLSRLVEKGYKVAIGEQVEDPKLAKGLVKREVVRVVTPGTNLCTTSLDETKNNYLMCVAFLDDMFGISITDITTGDFMVTEVNSARALLDEINKFMPSELVVNSSFYMTGIDVSDLKTRLGISVFTLENWYFDDEMCNKTLKEHFGVLDLQGLGLTEYPVGTIAAGALMKYLLETQKTSLSHIITITPYSTGKYMLIDTSTRRNLELTETLRE
ncbi:MAG: DNA mismatch repair protein MutS, partial [Lachnospiraceae bacterium]|nr:DNA mismatch repair protein MutS [Lachnospiraceae bacterium]